MSDGAQLEGHCLQNVSSMLRIVDCLKETIDPGQINKSVEAFLGRFVEMTGYSRGGPKVSHSVLPFST